MKILPCAAVLLTCIYFVFWSIKNDLNWIETFHVCVYVCLRAYFIRRIHFEKFSSTFSKRILNLKSIHTRTQYVCTSTYITESNSHLVQQFILVLCSLSLCLSSSLLYCTHQYRTSLLASHIYNYMYIYTLG